MLRFLIPLAFVVAAFGQTGAAISGTVTDSTGAGLPDASVSVTNVETGASRKIVTDKSGRYAAPALPVGQYEVSAERTGFSKQIKTGITLVVGQQQQVDLALPVGDLKQAITVEESATAVNTSTSQTSGLVGERQVKDLPLNGRSYDELLTLNPGIVNYSTERSGGVGTSNSAVGNMFAVSGRRPQENLFLLNGMEYTGASEINVTPGGASGQLLGVDAVREFNVVVDNYGAEYGKRPGAQISIVTASGTNELHGAVYEFLRNSALDARNFFDFGNIPQFQRNEFGGSLGGPVKKDKMFIFGNYEGFRQHLGLSDVTLVPDNNGAIGICRRDLHWSRAERHPAALAMAGAERAGFGWRDWRSVQPSSTNHSRGFRHHSPRLQGLSERDTLNAVYTIDDERTRTRRRQIR